MIDQNTRRKLFGATRNPIGEVMPVDNVPCVVIGVTADKKSAFGSVKSLNVWVPYTTASGRLFEQRYLDSITVRVRDGQPSAAAEKSLEKLMTQRHGRKDFFTYNMDSVVKTVEKTGQSLTLLLSLIAVISLVVGGIGVMNIMLVSVTERTREIGIRMAVGARQSDILQQFLVEAVLVCLLGGTIGIALSFELGALFSMFVAQWKMVFSAGAIVTAFVCSTLTGVIFGFMPRATHRGSIRSMRSRAIEERPVMTHSSPLHRQAQSRARPRCSPAAQARATNRCPPSRCPRTGRHRSRRRTGHLTRLVAQLRRSATRCADRRCAARQQRPRDRGDPRVPRAAASRKPRIRT